MDDNKKTPSDLFKIKRRGLRADEKIYDKSQQAAVESTTLSSVLTPEERTVVCAR